MIQIDEIAIITIISAGCAGISPVILAWLTGRQNTAMRRDQYAREDEISSRTAEAARLLLVANERVAASTAATNKKIDTTNETLATANENLGKIKSLSETIHALVNSNLTASKQAELDATKHTLSVMREMLDIKKAIGIEPTPEVLSEISGTEKRISALTAEMADRLS